MRSVRQEKLWGQVQQDGFQLVIVLFNLSQSFNLSLILKNLVYFLTSIICSRLLKKKNPVRYTSELKWPLPGITAKLLHQCLISLWKTGP